MNNIKNIFFDLDHTLWDFDKNSDLTFYKIFKKNSIGLDVSSFLIEYHPINRKYWELFREDKVTKAELRYLRLSDTFKKFNYSINDKLIYKLAEDYIMHLSDFNHLIDDAINVLTQLDEKYSMHIITNGFKEVQEKKLIKSKLGKFFKSVTISEDVGVKKPDKIIFNYALKKSNALIENSVMIGDNYNADIMGAINIGMKAIYFNFHKIDKPKTSNVITVNNLKDILKFFV